MTIIIEGEDEYSNYKQLEYSIPFQGYRRWVAFAYIAVNAIGFAANLWVLYIVAPLLFSTNVKVPKSILFYIITLCISDLMIMIGMLFLIIDIIVGTWKFSTFSCVVYLVFEAMNKFVAPVIVVLISRTCYVTICLDPKSRRVAASLKYAVVQVIASMIFVMIMLWPLFAYTQVSTLYFNANVTLKTVQALRKCTFMPPSEIELGFGIISCITSYAIPLGGMIYCCTPAPLRRLIVTVLVLTAIYVSCWSPYWLSIFAHKFMNRMSRSVVIASYYIHLLPYISCSAYPVIFTLLNRRIKKARAEMNWNQNRRKLIFTESSHATEQFPNKISSIRFLTILRICFRFLTHFPRNQPLSQVDSNSKIRCDSITNQHIEKETEHSIMDSIKQVNILQSTKATVAITATTSSSQDKQQLELIEMQDGDYLL